MIFEHLDEWQSLSASATENDACELHGLICGLLATMPGRSAPGLLKIMEPLGEWEWDEKARKHLQNGILEAAAALDSEDFSFTPILPADEVRLSVRTACLGAWCAGFIAGVGAGQGEQQGDKDLTRSAKKSGNGAEVDSTMAEQNEIIADMAQIARASAETEANDDASAEELEQAFNDLLEYVRTGAMVIRQNHLLVQQKSE